MRVLVVEDYSPLRESLVQGLREAGYAVDEASNGQDGLRLAQLGEHDVIILDLMLPALDGLSVLKTLRRTPCPSRILILTAKDTPEDRVRGLNLGADDYLIKPFDFGELLARIKALVRRKYETNAVVIKIHDLEVDTSNRVVRRGGLAIDLSGREYALLEYLAMKANRIVSRIDIWQHVYDFNASLESNVVDVFIGLLRKKSSGRIDRVLSTRDAAEAICWVKCRTQNEQFPAHSFARRRDAGDNRHFDSIWGGAVLIDETNSLGRL